MDKQKLFLLFTSLLLALTIWGIPLFGQTAAAQSENQLTLDTLTVAPSASGSFPLRLNNQDAVSSGEIHFSYNSTIGLQLTNAKPDSRLNGYQVTFSQDASDPTNVNVKVLFYVLGAQSVSPGNGAILLVDYTTTAQAHGSTPLTFHPTKTTLVGDGTTATTVPVNTTNGVFSIIDDEQPEITALQPTGSEVDTTVDVTITGVNTIFTANQSTVDLGAGINVSKVVVNSKTSVVVTLDIAADATAGPRDVTVTTGNEVVTKAAGFTVYANGPTPELMTIAPANGQPGVTVDVTIDGKNTNFVVGRTDADFGDDVTVNNVAVISPTQAIVEVTVAADAEPGERDVTLTSGNETTTKSGGFRVNVVQPPSGKATLYVDPSPANLTVGETASLDIVLSPGTTPMNGVQIHGQVDPAYLRLVNIAKGVNGLGEELEPLEFDATTGVFRFGAGVLGQTIREPFTVLTLEVEALKSTSAGGTPITFLNTTPPTDIAGPTGSIMEAARDGVVMITSGSSTATLQGRVDLQGRLVKPNLAWSIPLTLEMTLEGTSSPTIYLLTTDERGEFTLENLPTGSYKLRIKGDHTLGNRIESAALTAGVNKIFFGTLFEGDIDNDVTGNAIQIADFGLLSGSYDKCEGDSGYRANADLNESDDCVTIEDFGLLSPNFNRQGDIAYDSPTRIPAPMPLSNRQAVLEVDMPSVPGVGETVDLPLYVDPRTGDAVVGVTAHYRFDPAVVEVVEVLLTSSLPNVLLEPVIDNSQGAVKFSVSAPYGSSIRQRLQIATFRVTIKATPTGALLT
ncbi:MAG: hypothetical protein R3E79_24625, partial [Caldilineaceae bacterium]